MMPCSLRKYKHHCRNWVNSLVVAGLRPEIIVLEECSTQNELIESEKWHIAYWRAIGANLTNLTDGGDGMAGHRPSKEGVEKRAAAKRKIPSKEVPALIEKYLSGVLTPELGAQYGVSDSCICATLERHGVQRVVFRKKPDDSRWEEMAELHRSGAKYETIAGRYNTSIASVSRILRRHGIRPRMGPKSASGPKLVGTT